MSKKLDVVILDGQIIQVCSIRRYANTILLKEPSITPSQGTCVQRKENREKNILAVACSDLLFSRRAD